MTPWLTFVLAALATYRLSYMISRESGPFRVFRKLRSLPGEKSATYEMLTCPFCLSIYFSAAICVYLVIVWSLTWELVPLWWLAISGASVVTHQYIHETK